MNDFSEFLILSDMDGTFFGDGPSLVPRNLSALEEFRAGGGLFSFATGRNPFHMKGVLENPEALCNAPGILCNGACIYDFRENRILSSHSLGAAEVEALIDFAEKEKPDGQFRVQTEKGVYAVTREGRIGKDLGGFSEHVVTVTPTSEWDRNIHYWKFCFRDTSEALERLREKAEARFGDTFQMMYSGDHIFEIQHKGINKGAGVREIRAMFPERTVICCGDQENDLQLLGEADVAVCPANAIGRVRSLCDFTFCDCNEGLLGDLIAAIRDGRLKARR